jgi:hypothetical protein
MKLHLEDGAVIISMYMCSFLHKGEKKYDENELSLEMTYFSRLVLLLW